MNIFTGIILLVLLLFALRGYRRGLIRTLASIAFFFLAAVLVQFMTPHISNFLKEQTPLYGYLEERCAEAFQIEEQEEQEEKKEPSKLEQAQWIDGLPLPDTLKKQLSEHNNKAGYEQLAVDSFSRYIAGYMASFILNLLTYVVAFALVWLLLKIGITALDLLAHLPVFHGLNQILGLFGGLLQGLLIIWIVFLVITVCVGTQLGSELMDMIQESPILKGLYDSNLLLKYLMSWMGGL